MRGRRRAGFAGGLVYDWMGAGPMCDQGRGGALPPSVRRFSSRQTKLCGFFEENFYFLAHGEELIFLNKLFDVVANVNLNFFF